MKRIRNYSILTSTLALAWMLCSPVVAQDLRLGKYSKEELDMTSCSFEPEAPAIVLGEHASAFFSTGNIVTEVIRRIKIFDPEKAKDQADISIRYYAGESNDQESISNLKAQVMNMENGKEVITKLSKSDFYETDLGNGHKEIRFTFPNVRQGSILEYYYKEYSSSFFFINGWAFQNDIPTVFSRYEIDIPEHLDYRFLGQGINFILANQNKENKYGKNDWTLTNLRSTKPEPFMNNFQDYLDKIEFQLAGYKDFSNMGHYEPVLGSWQKLADELFDIDVFKSYFRNNSAFKELQETNVSGEDAYSQAEYCYRYIKDNFTLNDEGGYLPSQNIKKLLESKNGSKTELNLLLLAMLRAHGIQADPVLISSKGNGRAYMVQYPFVKQFNRLILRVSINDEFLFVDTSQKHIPFGYLPQEYHVDGGFLVDEKESKLIQLSVGHKSGLKQLVNIGMEKDSLHYVHTVRYVDYDAVDFLTKHGEMELEEASKWLQPVDNATLTSFSLDQKQGKTMQVQANFEVVKSVESTSPLLLIRPITLSRLRSNPFKVDERNFPVDFNYQYSDNYIATITIPEGYELDDFPEQMAITLPGNMAKFYYLPKADLENHILRINILLDLNTEIIQPNYYQELKAFIEFFVTKMQEPVVLKKIAMTAESNP